MQEINKIRYAGFFVRLWAVLIDGLIVSAALCLIRIPVGVITLGEGFNPLKFPVLFHFTAWDILLYILGSAYYVLMVYSYGATMGKKVLRLRVIAVNGEKLTFLTVLYRETVGKYLSSVPLCIGFFIIGADKEKRGFHDMLCDTRVIYDLEPRESRNMENTYMHDGSERKPKAGYPDSTYMPPTAYTKAAHNGGMNNSLGRLQDANADSRQKEEDIDSGLSIQDIDRRAGGDAGDWPGQD